MVRKTKPKTVHTLTAHVETNEPNIFQKVRFFLSHAYTSSKKAQTVKLSPEVWRDTSEEFDGKGGSALLTELFLRVLGRKLSLQRELCKRILIAAAWSLRMPVFIMPSGAVSLCMSPSGEEPRVAPVLRRLTRSLPLPDDVIDVVLAFAGDVWTAQRKAFKRNLFQFTSSYALETSDPKLRKVIKSVLPFESSTLCLSNMPAVETEWDASNKILWLRGPSIWPLIVLLRHHQRRRGAAAQTMTIRGFGDVLV
jgi:hypothetical protein